MDLFRLDIHTVISFLVIGNILALLILLTLRKSLSVNYSYRQFAAAKLFMAGGWLLLSYRGLIPDVFSAYIGNTILFCGFTLEVLAFLNSENVDHKRDARFAVRTVIGIVLFWVLGTTPGYKVAIASFFTVVIWGISGVMLVRQSGATPLRKTMGGLYLISALPLIFRGYFGIVEPNVFGLNTSNIVQTLSFVPTILLVFSTGTGYVLLLKEQNDRQLNESEVKFSRSFHASPIALLITEFATGKIIEVNAIFEELYEYTRLELLGRNIMELNFWKSTSERKQFLSEINQEGRIRKREIEFIKRSGERVIALLSAVVLDLNNTKVLLSSISDITHQKEGEKRLQEYSEKLRESNDAKDTFFSILAHDLRSPFNVFLNYSEILATDADNLSKPQIAQISNDLNKALHRQYYLLNDLLDWSRLQSGSAKPDLTKVSVNAVCNSVIRQLKTNASDKQITITNNLSDDLSVWYDERMLQLVFRNLISNAIKFSNPGGNCKIYGTVSDSMISIAVEDNGIGIAEMNLASVFAASHRSTPGTLNESGTGLGLTFCREVVERHGGKISVSSRLNEGSTFVFTIPTQQAII